MRTHLILRPLAWSCCVVLAVASAAAAEGWPGWRGPQRDGHLVGFSAPNTWPKELKQRWKIEVGEGHASPVVDGDCAYLFSREGEEEVLRAIRLADGEVLWRQSYPAPYKVNPAARSHGKGPKSTPIVADGRLVTLGISGILSAWDAKTGKRLWQHDFSGKYKTTSPLYGTAMSPLVEQGRVVAHVGGHDQGALMAFDLETGRPAWQWDDDGPAYTSPILATLDGQRQIITQSQEHSIGVSFSDGTLRWSMPFETVYTQNIITPVIAGELVIFSGIRKGTTAYRLEKDDGKWTPRQVWHNDEISMYMSSPVAVGDYLFGLAQSRKGEFFCLDVKTGKTLWTSDGRMGDNAAIVCTDDVILALTTGAELIAFRPSAERFEVLARYEVADTPTWAHPAIVGRQILIKDRTSLALWTMDD